MGIRINRLPYGHFHIKKYANSDRKSFAHPGPFFRGKARPDEPGPALEKTPGDLQDVLSAGKDSCLTG
jgi:hypothetical protein